MQAELLLLQRTASMSSITAVHASPCVLEEQAGNLTIDRVWSEV